MAVEYMYKNLLSAKARFEKQSMRKICFLNSAVWGTYGRKAKRIISSVAKKYRLWQAKFVRTREFCWGSLTRWDLCRRPSPRRWPRGGRARRRGCRAWGPPRRADARTTAAATTARAARAATPAAQEAAARRPDAHPKTPFRKPPEIRFSKTRFVKSQNMGECKAVIIKRIMNVFNNVKKSDELLWSVIML